ncbi:MAG: MarR family winged helix-turn-helix transcriptional regulator [Candidatus Acidiferrales bacterium]
MSADGAQPVMRRKEIEPPSLRKPGLVPGNAKAEHRRDRAPHIDTLIQLVSVRLVRLTDLLMRIGKITFEGRFGIKLTELRILIILGAYHSISVNEISRRTHIDKAWISRSLTGLLRRKLIKKTAHPADSRASSLSLTKKGEALLREIAPVAEEYQRQLLAGQQRADVERTLDLLAAHAEEIFQRESPKQKLPARRRTRQ